VILFKATSVAHARQLYQGYQCTGQLRASAATSQGGAAALLQRPIVFNRSENRNTNLHGLA